VKQEAQLRGGTARRAMSVEILSAAAQLHEKSHLKRLAIGALHCRSLRVILELSLFGRPYISVYIYILYRFRVIVSYFTNVTEVESLNAALYGVIYDANASTRQCQSAHEILSA